VHGARAQPGGYKEAEDVSLHTIDSGAHTRLTSVQQFKARAARCIPSIQAEFKHGMVPVTANVTGHGSLTGHLTGHVTGQMR
jgi:hypothetical protein